MSRQYDAKQSVLKAYPTDMESGIDLEPCVICGQLYCDVCPAVSPLPTADSKVTEATIRKAGQVAIDELIDRMDGKHPGNDDLADYLTRIVDACLTAAIVQAPVQVGEIGVKALTYDEVEEIIEKTEPAQLSDNGDRIWTRRMAVALADLFNERIRSALALPLPVQEPVVPPEDLRKRVMRAIFDPGATEGFKGERDLTTWQTDAVMRALAAAEGSAE